MKKILSAVFLITLVTNIGFAPRANAMIVGAVTADPILILGGVVMTSGGIAIGILSKANAEPGKDDRTNLLFSAAFILIGIVMAEPASEVESHFVPFDVEKDLKEKVASHYYTEEEKDVIVADCKAADHGALRKIQLKDAGKRPTADLVNQVLAETGIKNRITVQYLLATLFGLQDAE